VFQNEKDGGQELKAAMKSVCENLNLQPTDRFLESIGKMFDLIKVKQGVIILGKPFAGKTIAYKVLAAALSEVVI